MSEHRVSILIWAIVTASAIGLLLFLQPLYHSPVLRVAIVDSVSGERLRLAIPDLRKRLEQSEHKPVDIHVFSIPYEDLYDSLIPPSDTGDSSRTTESADELARPVQTFDVVLVDDPWIAALASKRVLSPLPHEWLKSGPRLGTVISDYAPEFLAVDFYRNKTNADTAGQPDRTPRRPPLNALSDAHERVTLDRAANLFDKGYELYALPYVGNMQALTVSRNIAQSVTGGGGGGSKELTWKDLEKQTSAGDISFYSRLGSDNGALVDFLPILWSYGGCLVTTDETGREIPGFTAGPGSPEESALNTSISISRKSSPEYSRFDESLLFNYVAGQNNLIAISWLAFRSRQLQNTGTEGLRWFQMPVSEAPAYGACANNEERLDTQTGTSEKEQRSGGLGLWSLAIDAKANEPELARKFIQLAVEGLDPLEGPDKGKYGPSDAECLQLPPTTELEPLPADANPFPSPLRSKMSCGTRTLVSRARPRLSHPSWREIEKAVGLRVREAHWQINDASVAVCRAAQDVQYILDKGKFKCPERAASGTSPIASGAIVKPQRRTVPPVARGNAGRDGAGSGEGKKESKPPLRAGAGQ